MSVNIQALRKQGYEVVEGADVGYTPHMRLVRDRGGDTIILVGTPHGRGDRVWTTAWAGSSARGIDEWDTRVGQPAMDVVAAEVAARQARYSRGRRGTESHAPAAEKMQELTDTAVAQAEVAE